MLDLRLRAIARPKVIAGDPTFLSFVSFPSLRSAERSDCYLSLTYLWLGYGLWPGRNQGLVQPLPQEVKKR